MARRKLRVDLHGFDVLSAVELARTRVAEAWRNGYGEVELFHGAAYLEEGPRGGRGRIKFELRRLVEEGQFDAFAERAQTWLRADSVVLTLKPNPRPRREAWSPEPRRAYLD